MTNGDSDRHRFSDIRLRRCGQKPEHENKGKIKIEIEKERERGKEELPLKQKATVCTPQRVRIVAAFLLFDFGAFNHGQIFILLFFEKRLKIV